MGLLTFPLANYPVGTTNFGPIALTNGLTGCEIRIARCTTATPTIWPSNTRTLQLSMDVSYDGGATYQDGQFSLMAEGGIVTVRGQELPETAVRFDTRPQVPTHIKGFVKIAGGTIRTSMSIQTN